MAVESGAVAAAAAYTAAKTAFSYNRKNYQYDEGGRRFARYTVGFNMAQAQTKQYREDIEDLTKMTVCKQDTYHTVGTIFFVLNFQLIMAGRLGVHGPAPPGWLLGMYWTNICSALMFLTVFTWMAMHASARAQAGGAFMRTRLVRLPIPTPKMLDKARTTGNRFEKQRLAEMFRIPFVMPAPKDQTTEAEADPESPERRIPRWYQQDEVNELHAGEDKGVQSQQACPTHFELHRGLQEEWWAYDVYSRVGVLYFMSHWLTSASLYSMCHVFTELRCIWPAWTVTACFVAAHYGILQLDIVAKPSDEGMNIRVEKVVPLVPFFAVAAMTIDYSVLNPLPAYQYLVYFLAWCAYILSYAWAWRLYQLAKPRQQKEKVEMPGRPWTPGEWQLPPAFEEAVYVVSAPKKLDAKVFGDQPCLTHELKVGKGVEMESSPKSPAKAAATQGNEPSLHAWKLFRGACISTIAMWSLMIFGRVFEQVNGERMLLKQEGRVERWPSHIQPWMAPWSRFGTRNEWCHAGGCDRRLSQAGGDVAHMAHQLVTLLSPLADAIETSSHSKAAGKRVASIPKVANLDWPQGFRPVHVTAADKSVVVLSLDHKGAMMKVLEPKSGGISGLLPFELHGLDTLGNVRGGSLQQTGLIITMDTGALAECAGLPVDGVWSCQPVGPKLPSFGPSMQAAVASRMSTGVLRAAVTLSEGEEEGTLLLLETDSESSSWLPVGEVRMPAVRDQMHLSWSPAADAVFMSSGTGEVQKWAFGSAEPTEHASAVPTGLSTTWHAASPIGDDYLVHLATQPANAAPKLYVRATSE